MGEAGRRSPAGFVVAGTVALAAFWAAGRILARGFERYVVEGPSMVPALDSSDFVVVGRRVGRLVPGQVVLAHDPRNRARVLAKRIAKVTAAGVELRGDNAAASTDSRTFGPVPSTDIVGRVVWRYWPLAGFGRIR